MYLIGERTARDGSIWPRAVVIFYGNAENERLTEWVNLTLDLLDENGLTFEPAGCFEEARERTVQFIDAWKGRKAEEEEEKEADRSL